MATNAQAKIAPVLPDTSTNSFAATMVSYEKTKPVINPPIQVIDTAVAITNDTVKANPPVAKPPVSDTQTGSSAANNSAPVLPLQNSNTNTNTNTQTITNEAPVYNAPSYQAPSYQAPVYNFDYPNQNAPVLVQSASESEKTIPGSNTNTETITPIETAKKSALGLDNYQLGSLVIGFIGVAYLIFSSRTKGKKRK